MKQTRKQATSHSRQNEIYPSAKIPPANQIRIRKNESEPGRKKSEEKRLPLITANPSIERNSCSHSHHETQPSDYKTPPSSTDSSKRKLPIDVDVISTTIHTNSTMNVNADDEATKTVFWGFARVAMEADSQGVHRQPEVLLPPKVDLQDAKHVAAKAWDCQGLLIKVVTANNIIREAAADLQVELLRARHGLSCPEQTRNLSAILVARANQARGELDTAQASRLECAVQRGCLKCAHQLLA